LIFTESVMSAVITFVGSSAGGMRYEPPTWFPSGIVPPPSVQRSSANVVSTVAFQ
jgi:hypothetical protein